MTFVADVDTSSSSCEGQSLSTQYWSGAECGHSMGHTTPGSEGTVWSCVRDGGVRSVGMRGGKCEGGGVRSVGV